MNNIPSLDDFFKPKYSDTSDQYRAEIDSLRIRLASMAGECRIYDEMIRNERKENDRLNAENVALREENARLNKALLKTR